jgi:hypothetical protein
VAGILLNRVDWKDSGAELLSGWPRLASSVCMEYAWKLALEIVVHSLSAFSCRLTSEAQIACRTTGFIRAAIEDLNWSRWVAGSVGRPPLGSTTDV